MRFYCVKQQDITDCGAACLATVSKQYGLNMPITRIREVAGTDKQGTNVYGVIKAAESLGFCAKGVKGDKKSLFSEFPLPCIAHVIVGGGLMHYVVIHKTTSRYLVIADPAKGIVKLKLEEFVGENSNHGHNSKYHWTGILIMMSPTASFRAEKNTKGLFQRFFALLLPQKKLLIHIFFASLFYTIFGILGAFYFQILIDYILPSGLNRTLTVLSLGVLALTVFKVMLDAFRSHLLLYLSQKLDIALLLGYYKHVVQLPMHFFCSRKVGEIISRFQDAVSVRDAISGATLTIMIDTVMAVIGGSILYRQNVTMFFITISMIAFYVIIVVLFRTTYERWNRKQMEDNAQLTSYLVESLNGIQTIKTFNAEGKANRETEKRFIKLLKSVFHLGWMQNIQTSLKISVELIGVVFILWIGSINVIAGRITIGQLVVFNSLLVYFIDPVKNLVNLQPQIQSAMVAADRLGEILDIEIEKTKLEEKKLELKSINGEIEFKHVNFRYGTRKLVLENINFYMEPGQKIAFVGESGSGKTTLAKLLLHLYEIESGEILIDANNINDIKVESLREKIAYISQEIFLFSGSIMENLTLGLEDCPLAHIIEAAKLAQAHEFINELPLRYETQLEENGENLSGGQRQRLSIARAILKQPDVLILDEATSQLDTITERALEETIKKYCKKMTTIYIAHRLSTIKNCDMIFVMHKGKIVEQGTHEQLKNLKGKYAELVRQQSLESGESV